MVYITADKTYRKARKRLEDAGVDTGGMFFIDATSHKQDIKKGENAIFVRPQDLYNISISLSTALDHFSENDPVLVVVNSLTTLAVYNPENTVTQFSQHIISKIEDKDKQTVLMALSGEEHQPFLSQVAQFADGQHMVE